MVRIGEYSPNFRGNSPRVEGASRGIFGFGEYEEKRKYYNEQRKLEFKQYVAQQALKSPCAKDSKNESHIPTTDTSVVVSCSHADTTSVRRDAATQTNNGEQRDASTNTDVANSRENHNVQSNDNLINQNSTNLFKTSTWDAKERASTKIDTPHNLSNGGLPRNSKQDSVNGLDFVFKERDRHNLNAITAAYERELRAQIEEKKSRTRELERREQQEAESRERWLAEEASRELERRGVEEKRIKTLEDCRRQRVEEFRNRSEQLKKEAKEIREMKMRDRREVTHNVMISTESNGNGRSYSLGEVISHQTSKSMPKGGAIQSQKSDKVKLRREQCDVQERHLEQDSIGQEVLKGATTDGVIPKTCLPICHLKEDDLYLNSSTDKNYSNTNSLSQLGEIRRKLATQQVKMEEAFKK